MKTVMIQYKTKNDQVAANEALVHAVYDELRRVRPAGLKYGTFRLEDGVSFVHITGMETPAAEAALASMPSFIAFQKDIKDRCVEGPVLVELSPVDSYAIST